MKLEIPYSLKAEHDEIHEALHKATQLTGKTAEAAQKVARLLRPHFMKEEKYAMPPLALLQVLSKGEAAPEMKSLIREIDQFRKELPGMLDEHREIHLALRELIEVSTKENLYKVVDFSKDLMRHAKMEEEIIYPTAILIGEYLKMKFPENSTEPFFTAV